MKTNNVATKKTKPVGRPARTDKNNKTASSLERGTKPGWRRKAYIVDSALADKIDAIAYWDRKSIKDVVNDAFTDHVTKYEKKSGPIKAMPKK